MPAAVPETIFALSSGSLPSGVAVVRVSGAETRFVVETLCGEVPRERFATLRSIRKQNGSLIDRGLLLFFAGPDSFTGEDIVEFHLHGGKAVVDVLYEELSRFPRVRIAKPGEFSLRAFHNGKMDLTQAEGLADLIAAETEMQRRLALSQANGGLLDLYGGWSRKLLWARSLIEAELDFSDEDDIPGSVSDAVWSEMAELSMELENHLNGAVSGEIQRDGYRVVIAGPPNAGKSTLLNALAGRDVAIVSDEAGTTRDRIEVHLDLAGYKVNITDTAGLRLTESDVEKEGIRRSLESMKIANLVLHLNSGETSTPTSFDLTEIEDSIHIRTKLDLNINLSSESNDFDVVISAKTGQGLDALLDLIVEKIQSRSIQGQDLYPTRARHRDNLGSALEALHQAVINPSLGLELRSEFLRQADHSLGLITGQHDVEDLLGVIFSEFCVGK